MADLRYAIRVMFRNPVLSGTIVLTLALAVGATTAIFTIVDAVLLAPLPVSEPGRVVAIWETNPKPEQTMRIASTANVESWRASSRQVETFGVWRDWGMRLIGREGPESLSGAIASADLLALLQVQPAAGRFFTRDEEQSGRNAVVVLGHRFWRDRFGSDPAVVGTTLTLTRSDQGPRPFLIVGVMPADVLPSMSSAQFWAPATLDPDLRQGRWLRNRRVFARLAPGATIDSARAELAGISAALGREFPESNGGWGVALLPLADVEIGSMRAPLAIFSVAIVLLLAIACANVAALLLARATGRTRELGIRLAIGARRGRIIRLLLTESLVLSAVGAAAGALVAAWLVSLFIAYGPGVPRADAIALNARAGLFTIAVAALTGLLFGLAPALQSASIAPVTSLKNGGSFLRMSGLRVRTGLVTVEIALALVLLVGAGLAMRSFSALLGTPLGVTTENLIVFQVFPPAAKYADEQRLAGLYRDIAERLRAIPGVGAVGGASAGPLFGGEETVEMTIEGTAAVAAGAEPHARFFDVTPGYFQTMGVPIVSGRDFTGTDTGGAPPVAIVNETFARVYLGGRGIGTRVKLAHDSRAPLEIVGVARDVRQDMAPGTVPGPEIYWPADQDVRGALYFIVRTLTPPDGVAPGIRPTLQDIDRDLAPARLTTMEQLMDRTTSRPRFNTLLLGAFAAVALLLATVGIYGLVSYSVSQRTREIGVRISLGASASDIVGLVLGQGLRAVATGIACGIGGALVLTRFMASVIAGVEALDPLAFAGAAALLGTVTLVATLVPARRAARVDPVVALKTE